MKDFGPGLLKGPSEKKPQAQAYFYNKQHQAYFITKFELQFSSENQEAGFGSGQNKSLMPSDGEKPGHTFTLKTLELIID